MPKPYTAKEIAAIDGDRRYWEKLARSLGWRVYGFTDRKHASFITGPNQSLSLSASQRDAIVDKIQELSGLPIKLPKCLTCDDDPFTNCALCVPRRRRRK